MSRRNKVDIREDVVVKIGDPAVMHVEVAKTVKAYEIAESCGLFRVPKVLDYDEKTGTITQERLHDIDPVMPTVAFRKDADSLLDRIGQCLAVIHRDLVLPDGMKVELPEGVGMADVSQVFIHGDFNGSNVCVNNRDQSIAILDWQMTRVYGGAATFGTRFFDLTSFINGLFYRSVEKYLFARPAAPAARRFLESYFEASGTGRPVKELWRYMEGFFDYRLAWRKRNQPTLKRLLMIPTTIRLKAFLKSGGTPGPAGRKQS